MKHIKYITRSKHFKRSVLFIFCCAIGYSGILFGHTTTTYNYDFENNLTIDFSPKSEESPRTTSPSLFVGSNSNITYANKHEASTTEVASAAPARMMPTIGYDFRCSCRENPLGSGGNATTISNGQFVDFVEVTSVTGENWTVVSANGFFEVSSLQPPSSPTIIAPGTTLNESFAGSGVYQLMGVHVESVGYTLTVTNGTDVLTAQVMAGECAYPEPSFVDLRAGYCLTTPAFALTADDGGSTGTGTFDILSSDGTTTIVPNAVTFDAAALGLGTYLVRYTFAETGGCTQAIEQMVSVSNPAGTLACNDNIQISLVDNCEALIVPDMILDGTYESFDVFDVQVSTGPIAIANPVTQAYEGQVLTVNVVDFCSGNSCEGTIIVEDKQAPVFTCPAATITIDCTADPDTVAVPLATDNCDSPVVSQLVDENITDFECDDANGLIRRITREFTAIDNNGNQTQTNCIQTIEIPRADLINVIFPSDVLYDCGSNFDTSPAGSGRPTLNGVPILNNSICNFYSFSSDDTLQTCGNSYKIVRSWSVLDWCNASSTPTNTILAEQIINVQDITPPSVTCPANFTVSTNDDMCTADISVPVATVTDNCGTFTTQIFSPLGQITNGTISGLSIGAHMLIYNATDECGNFTECPTIVTVEDAETPIMACDEFTAVTLNENGIAEVAAEDFDDGSYDGCTAVDFSVRRMDGNGVYQPTVTLDCNDTETPVQVELQAEDAFGNTNSCMVTVTVTDNFAPILSCSPNDVTIECTQNFEDFFTPPTVSEACQTFPLQFFTVENINSCGMGSVTRTYVVSDANGNTSTCIKTVTITNSDLLQLSDIDFPDDYDSAVCGTSIESLAPDSLPQPFSVPVIDNPACSQIAVSVQDEQFTTDGACLKIFRTWTVINWCEYDPADASPTGIFTSVQEITVVDNTPPVLVCPPNPFLKIINPNCDTTIFVFGPQELTDCSNNISISSTLQKIPVSDPDNMLMTSDGLGPYEDLSPGQYSVFLTADDGCGNSTTCNYILAVEDNKPPTPYCKDTLVITLMETGMIEFNVQDFDAGSFDNCTAPEDLLFSYSINPFDSLMTFTCNDIGPNTILMYVTDESFNRDVCQTTLVIQNTMADCGMPRTVSGFVHTEYDEGVADVMISVNSDEAMTTTDLDGMYSVGLEEGGDYTLVPEKDINPKNGITTLDVVKIRQHVLSIEFLDSPYKIIAADVNNSGSITTSDVVALRRLVLDLDSDFEFNTSWRFVAADFVFPNPANPFESGFPEFRNINNLTEDVADVDFIAVKIGDVNETASGLNFGGNDSEERSQQNLLLRTENTILRAGETQTIWLEAETETIQGWQGTMEFSKDLSLLDIVLDEGIEAQHFNTTQKSAGTVQVSWENAAFAKKNIRFGLTFQAKESVQLSEALAFSDKLLHAESYHVNGGDLQIGGVELVYSELNVSDFILHQNTPNPFAEETLITFELPETQQIQFSVYDASGQQIFLSNATYAAGLQRILLSKDDLKDKRGVLFYQIQGSDFVEVKRMVRH